MLDESLLTRLRQSETVLRDKGRKIVTPKDTYMVDFLEVGRPNPEEPSLRLFRRNVDNKGSTISKNAMHFRYDGVNVVYVFQNV
jgi:hypothetical protein